MKYDCDSKIITFLIKVFSLITIFLILVACEKSHTSFSDLLDDLNETPAEQRQQILDRFIIRQNNFPVVEDTAAYFILREKRNTDVYLSGDMNGWAKDSIALHRIEGADLYMVKQSYPLNARLEYKFIVNGKYILDPLNSYKDRGGFGENSVLMMPDYIFPTEILAQRAITKGTIDTITFKSWILKDTRDILYYHHPQADKDAPLIIFHDGGGYLEYACCNNILDNLINNGQIPPLNAMFVNPIDRAKEYWLNDKYLRMLFKELIPFVKRKYNLSDSIKTGMGGASLGGLITFYTLKDYSQNLDFIFSQSGAFWADDEAILDIIKQLPSINTIIYLDYGSFEGTADTHKRLIQLLKEKGAHFSYGVYNEGHNWGSWRAHLDEALKFVFTE